MVVTLSENDKIFKDRGEEILYNLDVLNICNFDRVKKAYENQIKDYIKNSLIPNISLHVNNGVVKISMKELAKLGFEDLINITLSDITGYYKVKDWIEKLLEEELRKSGENKCYNVVLCDYPEEFEVSMREIPYYVNKVVKFNGVIISASYPCVLSKKHLYICPKCGRIKEVYFDELFWNDKVFCKFCGGKMEFANVVDYEDFQELVIQDLSDESEYYGIKEHPIVWYCGAKSYYFGHVRITGIVREVPKNSKSRIYDFIVQAINVEKLGVEKPLINLTEEDVKNIKKVAKRGYIIDILADILIPPLFCDDAIVRKAILLQQIAPYLEDRGKINILLVTDVGIDKTDILKRIGSIPGNNFINIAALKWEDLTVSYDKRSNILGEFFTVNGGVVPRTLGVLCIDDFNENKKLSTKLSESFERNVLTVNKGSFYNIPAECSFLCACYPKTKFRKLDPKKSIIKQIEIPSILLKNFDLIFPIRNIPNKCRDKEVAKYIFLKYVDSDNEEIEGYDYVFVDVGEEKIKIDFNFVVKYIFYSRHLTPIFTDEAIEKISNWYDEMRKNHYITAKQLNTVIKLSIAVAKAKLKNYVDEEDVKEAIDIIMHYLKQVVYNPKKGIIDVTLLYKNKI